MFIILVQTPELGHSWLILLISTLAIFFFFLGHSIGPPKSILNILSITARFSYFIDLLSSILHIFSIISLPQSLLWHSLVENPSSSSLYRVKGRFYTDFSSKFVPKTTVLLKRPGGRP